MRSLAVQHALTRRVRALARHLPAALEDDVEALHDARVASRRLRELLGVLASSAENEIERSWRRYRSRARRLTRALGAVRELDVTLALFDELAAAHPSVGTAVLAARLAVEEERRSQRAAMLQEVSASGGATLADDVETAAPRLDLGPRSTHISRLRRRLAVRVDNLDGAIDAAGALYAVDRLHTVRIAVKQLRYVLELVNEIARIPVLRLVGRLKRAQDVLGRLHDLDVAAGYVRRSASPSGRGETEQLLRVIDGETRKLHAAYLGLAGSLRDTVTACRGEVDARLGGLLERKRAPRLPRSVESGNID